MTPTHLTELRLEIIAAHIVHCCANSTTNFALEKYGRLPEEPDRATLSTEIILHFPDRESVSTTSSQKFVVWTESHTHYTSFLFDWW